jgi:hypothetical protein
MLAVLVLCHALLRHSSSSAEADKPALAAVSSTQSTLQAELARVEHAESELFAKVRSGGESLLKQVPVAAQPTIAESMFGALGRFGLMLAIFIYAGLKGRQRGFHTDEVGIKQRNFSAVGLCACTSNLSSFFEACCCPDILWAETASEKAKLFPWLTFTVAACIVLGLNLLAAVTGGFGALAFCLVRLHSRMSLRKATAQDTGSPAMDFVHDCAVTTCCFGCAQYQEAEFVDVYEKTTGKSAKQ